MTILYSRAAALAEKSLESVGIARDHVADLRDAKALLDELAA